MLNYRKHLQRGVSAFGGSKSRKIKTFSLQSQTGSSALAKTAQSTPQPQTNSHVPNHGEGDGKCIDYKFNSTHSKLHRMMYATKVDGKIFHHHFAIHGINCTFHCYKVKEDGKHIVRRFHHFQSKLHRNFFCRRPLPFGGSPLETYPWTSRESNHHRQSVRIAKNDALPTEPRGHLVKGASHDAKVGKGNGKLIVVGFYHLQ